MTKSKNIKTLFAATIAVSSSLSFAVNVAIEPKISVYKQTDVAGTCTYTGYNIEDLGKNALAIQTGIRNESKRLGCGVISREKVFTWNPMLDGDLLTFNGSVKTQWYKASKVTSISLETADLDKNISIMTLEMSGADYETIIFLKTSDVDTVKGYINGK